MNAEKVETIFRRLHPEWKSGYDYPRRTGFIDWYDNSKAIWWGCRKAEELASAGCAEWAHSFWVWSVDCYHYRHLYDDGTERHCGMTLMENDQRIETRILRAAHFMWERGVDSAINIIHFWSNALTDDQFKLITDAWNRGQEPQDALWPKPRRNRNYIALLAAAQTIATHETAKS
jgi:hypothetical protein